MKRKLYIWLPSILYIIAIFVLSHGESLLNDVDPAYTFAGMDKLAHFVEFAVLYLLLHRSLYLDSFFSPAELALGFSLFFAFVDEFHQSFLPYRDCELGDLLADGGGIFFAYALLNFFIRKGLSCKVPRRPVAS